MFYGDKQPVAHAVEAYDDRYGHLDETEPHTSPIRPRHFLSATHREIERKFARQHHAAKKSASGIAASVRQQQPDLTYEIERDASPELSAHAYEQRMGIIETLAAATLASMPSHLTSTAPLNYNTY